MEPHPVGVIKVEFISEGEVAELLQSHGIAQVSEDEDHVYCRMGDEAASHHVHLGVPGAGTEPREGAQVYDIEADRTELNDLSQKHADRAKSMAESWETWAIAAKAKPWPWGPRKKKPAREKKK